MKALAYPGIGPDKGLIVGLTVTAFLAGTGGLTTADYYSLRGAKGYAFAQYDLTLDNKAISNRTSAENLAHFRSIFKPTVTDLAGVLGVSRQAVYDWNQGKPVAPANAARLADLAQAADLLLTGGVTTNGSLLNRPIADGKSLFDIVRAGGSAEDSARKLLSILQREQQQQERLAVRLSRRRPSTGASEDFTTPMLDEAG